MSAVSAAPWRGSYWTSPARLCLLAIAAGVPIYLPSIELLTRALQHPEMAASAELGVMALLRNVIAFVAASHFLLAVWLWRHRHDTAIPIVINWWIVGSHALVLLAAGLATGTYTSPANLPTVIGLVVGLALQPPRIVVTAFFGAIGVGALYQVCVLAGFAPYAPLIVPGTFQGRMPVTWWWQYRSLLSYGGLPVGIGLILWVFARIDRQREALTALSQTDGLTQLYNRRHFMERLGAELMRHRRYGFPVSLVLCDADHFKRVNDTYGHHAGDDVLREIGHIFRRTLRPMDLAARLGGEEFALILPECDLARAGIVCERLRRALEAYEFEADGEPGDSRRFRVTMSMGAVECCRGSSDALLAQADANLYEAKRQGRNRVVATVFEGEAHASEAPAGPGLAGSASTPSR